MKPGDLARKAHDGDYKGRTELFFNKLFERNDEINSFQTDIGLVRVQEVVMSIRDTTASKKRINVRRMEVNKRTSAYDIRAWQDLFEAICIEGFRGGNGIAFECTSDADELKNFVFDMDLADFSKNQFGGRGAGSKKVNFGNEYEEKLAATYTVLAEGNAWELKPFAKHVKVMHETLSAEAGKGKGLTYVQWAGPENTPRPLVESGGKVLISSKKGGVTKTTGPIGDIIKDILVQYGGTPGKFDSTCKNTYYISVKYGPTLAFFNCGVTGKGSKDATAFFVPEDMKDGDIAPAGQSLLDMFNIEADAFIDIFKNFGKGGSGKKPPKVQTTLDTTQKSNLQALIKTGVGYGYWMAHFIKGQFHFYEVNESYADRASTLVGNNVELQYGGGDGRAKRINMLFRTKEYDFTFNIRNKQGGVWPSHSNGDYTKL